MADLTTLTNVQEYGQIPATDTAAATVLSRLISAFSQWFLTQVNRGAFLESSYTEQRNGQGGDLITPIYWPLVSVQSVTVDGVSIPLLAAGQTPGFWADSFTIFLSGHYRFRRGRGNVQLSYTAGYPSVPLDVEQAIIDQVLFTFRRAPNLGTVSQAMNGITTVSYSQKELAPGVQAVVNFYRDRAVVGM